MAAAKKYRVTAAAAVVRGGGTERYLYRGAVVPAGVSAADIARLVKMGLISLVAAAAEPVRAVESADPADAQ